MMGDLVQVCTDLSQGGDEFLEYRKLWKSLSSHIELYGMTAINFRTTFCTMMVASGVDIKTAQALMGHATPEMTLKIYAKQEESRIPDAIEKVSSFLAAQ